MSRYNLFLIVIIVAYFINVSQQLLNTTTYFTTYLAQQLGKASINYDVITGYIPLNWYYPDSSNTSLFFEIATKQGTKINSINIHDPLIIWIPGGPGGSSMYEAWQDFGPFGVDNNKQFFERKNSQNYIGNLLYLEMPLGVGFSYSALSDFHVNTTEQASQHFQNFLYNFMMIFPQFKNNPIFFNGISYAGHFIPHFVAQILKNDTFSQYNIQGVAIGDGWINPRAQQMHNAQLAYTVGVCSLACYQNLYQMQLQAEDDYQQGNLAGASGAEDAVNAQVGQYGEFDSTENFETYGADPYIYLYDLFKDKQFLNAYGVPSFVWAYSSFSGKVYSDFKVDIAVSFQEDLEYLLNLLPVTLYQGQLDLELTNSGQQQIIYDLNWSGLEKFRGAQKQVWRKYEPPNNDVLGNYKTSDNLTFAIVYGAGHISGGDKPDTIYDLVFREVNERWDN